MRANASYRTTQLHYLKQHYQDYPAAHFAELWGVTEKKVYRFARRHNISKRAPNGQPVWRSAA